MTLHNKKCFLIFCLVLIFMISFSETKKIPRWWLKVAQKQGPNACVVEEIPGTNREFWTECRYWLNRDICGQKTRIRFECCEGFDQIDGEDGCSLVKPLKNILETAEALGATKWVEYIRESGLENEFESPGAYTLFVPTNDAFDAVESSLDSQLDSYRSNPNNPVILYHIVPSKLRSEDFEGDQIIETRQGRDIRINKYSNGMTTINCALLLRKDQEATNGIVHLIDGVLDPFVANSNDVAEIILNDGRFQVLASMLEKSGYINILRTLQNSVTILAPSDEAFQKLPTSRREKIVNDRDARLAILQNHIIPHVICESAITGEHKVRTKLNSRLTFRCDIGGAYVETTKMRGDFNLGKDGIIHVIDDVLLPDRAKNLIELAESRNLETFVQFVKQSGLEETLSHNDDYTFFVPDENAWLEMPPEALAKTRLDPEYAGLMLRYHGSYGRHLTNTITDNQAIMSLDEENPVRLQVWRKAMGIEDARITESDIEAQNGVIHIINKVIFPSNQSVESNLRNSDSGHSFLTFLSMLNPVSNDPSSVIDLRQGENRFYTFFVPTDNAFQSFDQNKLDSIMTDRNQMKNLVESHLTVNMFPKISFEPGLTYSIDGIQGNFNIKKNADDVLTVNGAIVLESHMSANGVVHVIDEVFDPDDENSRVYTVRKIYSSTRTIFPNQYLGNGEEDDEDYDHLSSLSHSKGNSIAGSKKRKTSYALPEKKKSRRRDKIDALPDISKISAFKTVAEVAPRRSTFAERRSKVGFVNKTSATVSTTRLSAEIIKDSHEKISTNNSLSNRLESKTLLSGRYNYSGTIYAYPAKLSGSRYDTHYTNPTDSEKQKAFGFYYNYSWPGGAHSSDNSAYTHNLTMPLPISRYRFSKSSSFYNSSSLTNNPQFSTYDSVDNSVGPPVSSADSSNGSKFSYVGHPYGQDVVGHRLLPFSSAGSTYVNQNGSAGEADHLPQPFTVQGERINNDNNKTRINHRKRVHKTQTVYTYPSGSRSKYFSKSTREFFDRQIVDKSMQISSTAKSSGKKTHQTRVVSAPHALADDDYYADGTEFSEARSPTEEMITANQAKILRKQWKKNKKKRHHHHHHQRQRPKKNARRRRTRKMRSKKKHNRDHGVRN